MACKELEVSDIREEVIRASVHGQVVEMSPVKRSRKNKDVQYVEGQLSDGKQVCWFVSFDVKIKDEIDKMKESGVDSDFEELCN